MPTIKEQPIVPDYYSPKTAELTGTPQEAELIYTLDNGSRFVIHSDAEVLEDIYNTAKSHAPAVPRVRKAAVAVVERAVTAPSPKAEYVSLADLDARSEARMALKALAYDIRTFGRNDEYRRFKARVAAEKDLAMDMELGLVNRVHCRLHERMLAKADKG